MTTVTCLFTRLKLTNRKEVVDEILASQAQLKQKQLGLEAGSKPELLAVMALAQKSELCDRV